MLQPQDNNDHNLYSDDHNFRATTRRKLSEPELQSVLQLNGERQPSFPERWKSNRFWAVRASYVIVSSVWMVVMGIGTLIAWLIAMLFI